MKLNLEIARHAMALRNNEHFIAFVSALATQADQDNEHMLDANNTNDMFHLQGRVSAYKDALDALAGAPDFIQKYEDRS